VKGRRGYQPLFWVDACVTHIVNISCVATASFVLLFFLCDASHDQWEEYIYGQTYRSLFNYYIFISRSSVHYRKTDFCVCSIVPFFSHDKLLFRCSLLFLAHDEVIVRHVLHFDTRRTITLSCAFFQHTKNNYFNVCFFAHGKSITFYSLHLREEHPLTFMLRHTFWGRTAK
jgi:hypothetical protein